MLTKYFFLFYFILKFSLNFSVGEIIFFASNDDCIINSSCVNNYCQCLDGYIYSGDRTKCLKVVASFNETCEESQQCSEYLMAGGVCDNGICLCKLGYHYLHGRCWKTLNINENCSSDNNCYVNFEIGAAKCLNNSNKNGNKTCQCSKRYYQREYRSCRRRAQKLGDDCLIHLDCAFDPNKNHTCDDKTRKCALEIENSEKKLIQNKLLNINVNGNFNSTFHSNNERINCSRAHFYSQDKKICVAEIGEPCEINETALITKSICLNGRWSCENAFVPTLNNRVCKKVTENYNQSCLINESCYIFGPDALCKNQKCLCNDNSHFINSELFCWINKKPGEFCNDDKDCFVKETNKTRIINIKCVNNICTCPNGSHVNSNKTCVPDVKAIGDFCTESADCRPLENTNCVNNSCLCVENFYEQSGKCFPGLNTKCDENLKCKVENSCCKRKICTCCDKFVNQSQSLCVPISEHGKICKFNIQCKTSDINSFCMPFKPNITVPSVRLGICHCLPGYHHNYGICRQKKVLGESCNKRGQCFVQSSPHSVICSNGLCKCQTRYQKLNETYCERNYSTTISLSMWILLAFTILKLLL